MCQSALNYQIRTHNSANAQLPTMKFSRVSARKVTPSKRRYDNSPSAPNPGGSSTMFPSRVPTTCRRARRRSRVIAGGTEPFAGSTPAI